jgi:methyl coenzyme M reductase subunit C-like uncharacterized protein (methanogenesis marker protein 7)
MPGRLLVVEDGTEYTEFARIFLAEDFDIATAHSAAHALAVAREATPAAMLVDLRFDRTPTDALVGDVRESARRLFGGDEARALRHLQDQQGTLILGELRKAGFDAPAVFVHDFPPRRLENLNKLYGPVRAVPSFDASRIRAALREK